MDVILGAPFSNATYVLFEEVTGNGHLDAAQRHPYYQALYRPVSDRSSLLTRALLVVLDSSFVTAVDFPIPGKVLRRKDRPPDYEVRELDMTLSYAYQSAARDLTDRVLGLDPSLLGPTSLSHVSVRERVDFTWMVEHLLAAVDLARPLVCGHEFIELYRAVGQLLSELGAVPSASSDDVLNSGGLLAQGIGAYQDICGLTVRSNEFEIFAEVRSHEAIRKYASQFTSTLVDGGSVEKLLESIEEARDLSHAARSHADTFAATSTTLSLGGLIPGLGAITGIPGAITDLSARAAQRRADHHAWYALGPEVMRFESEAQLRRYFERPRNS